MIVQEQSKEYNAFENISSGNIKYSALTCFYMSFLGLGNGVCTILLGVSVSNPLLIMLGFDPLVSYILIIACCGNICLLNGGYFDEFNNELFDKWIYES